MAPMNLYHPSMGMIPIAIALAAWLVAAWAMVRMVFAALMDPERRSLWSLISPSMPLASYNRKNFRLFAVSMGFAMVAVIIFIVLGLMGYIKP
jgi:hypothetical protein